MKKLVVGLVFLVVAFAGQAQTFAEWFSQNSTRLKYYGEQIAALQVYIGQAEKGYQIVESGLGTVRDVKSGEFNLHNAFYTSLGTINPSVGKLAEVAEIAALQVAIVKRFSAALSRYRQDAHLRGDQITYIGNVYGTVLSVGLADVNALLDILTADKLKLSDDQRANRIRELDRMMRDRYAFTLAFTDQADLLTQQRQAEEMEMGMVKGLYGLP
jgi:hypothetical protein